MVPFNKVSQYSKSSFIIPLWQYETKLLVFMSFNDALAQLFYSCIFLNERREIRKTVEITHNVTKMSLVDFTLVLAIPNLLSFTEEHLSLICHLVC